MLSIKSACLPVVNTCAIRVLYKHLLQRRVGF